MKRIVLLLFSCVAITSMSYAQIVINEICAANADVKYDPQYYNFSPWVELYNAGSSAVNLNGYYVSDDPAVPNKFRLNNQSIPAKAYLLIWCDDMNSGTHTNFSLDSDGEFFVLSNASSQLVDQVEFPKQYTNVSYGRISNGTAMGYLVNASPSGANAESGGTEVLDKPELSVDAGRHSGSRSVSCLHSASGVSFRYTLDGSEPNGSSSLYSAPIMITSTKTLKVRAYKNGFLPSETVAATYFINEHAFSLPVISLSTSDAYLNSDLIGIYVEGTNGITLNCSNGPRNWNQDWDRHAVIEYFEPSGNKKFDQHIDIRLGGACSRNFPQKSFVVKARDKYGSKLIEQKLFPNKDINAYGGFVLRNSGNDFNMTHFRDAVEQAIVADQMDIDYLDYQPTIVYLNGKYWGILNMREKIDADYIEANYNIDKDDLDLLETDERALEGTKTEYVNYRTALGSMDRSTPEAYDFISENIDVQSYINYLVTEIYYGNTDWPGNNVKFWRQRSNDSPFRWILWDMDFGFGIYDDNMVTHPTLNFATVTTGDAWPNPAWSTLHIRLVLDNPKFREQFIKTFNTALNTTFAPERVIGFLNSFQSRIATEMPYHKTRWGGSINDFNYQVERMRQFARNRNSFMRQHLREFFGTTSEDVSISIKTNPVQSGSFTFNGITSDAPVVDGIFPKGMAYDLKPVNVSGYKFKSWKVTKRDATPVPLIDPASAWRYFDQGVVTNGWNTAAFDDASWSTGQAQLGYGDGDEQTVISYGPDAANKYVTSYFRKTFTVADTVGFDDILGEALFDDGIVVYLNGVEMYRSNMPQGVIDRNTLALGNLPAENIFYPFKIAKGIIKPGMNVLAVEVHQNGVGSSDLSFDLSMRTVKLGAKQESTTTTPALTGTAYSALEFEALFEVDNRVITGLVINEISAIPSAYRDGNNEAEDWFEIKNVSGKAVNLAGLFLTDNPSQKKKHIILADGSETMLAPGAYKIFWADEELAEGKDHVRFKLSADGEMVGLYQELDGVITAVDEMYYNAQTDAGSWSRIPDGTGPLVHTDGATPGAVNMLTVTSVEPRLTFQLYPNPVASTLWIQSAAIIDEVVLIDSFGHEIKSFKNVTGNFNIPMNDVARGLYLVRIISGTYGQTTRVVKE
ncbi:CotH kinase family protein [Pseudochryseolinea flava]|uniref:LTD domain-containing protein n=1 Tax=Pseudochryseolinea flava TaxID=2059302 RepID=A0A364Y337_9BACT|nr:CotH kinase family protein [Pseudochryseolinea flava]RAW00556.1 hypothetical protein DQQ10_13230 [Pseudochryseolinea flava]